MSCCDSWYIGEPNGVCPVCGEETVDGHAATGCGSAPIMCDTCGASPCDGSC